MSKSSKVITLVLAGSGLLFLVAYLSRTGSNNLNPGVGTSRSGSRGGIYISPRIGGGTGGGSATSGASARGGFGATGSTGVGA